MNGMDYVWNGGIENLEKEMKLAEMLSLSGDSSDESSSAIQITSMNNMDSI